MTSNDPPARHFLAEPIALTSRNNTRQASNRSDVSDPASRDSDSTESSMAVHTKAANLVEHIPQHELKNDVVHVELTAPQNEETQVVYKDNVKQASSKEPTAANEGVATAITTAGSTQHKPRRKFAPEPVETTTRSSKKEKETDGATSPTSKRKFVPEPVETTSRSSKVANTVPEENKSSKPRRKFAVEPIETTVKNSKDREKKKETGEAGARPKRRFAVEPIETSARNSKDKSSDPDTKSPNTKRKFAVEPIETYSAHKTRDKEDRDDAPSRSSSGGRRFVPELVGTAKGSYRKKPVASAVPGWLRKEAAEDEGLISAPDDSESRFSAAALARKARADPRRHSYSVPDLPMIQSDSSEDDMDIPQTPGPRAKVRQRDHHTLQPDSDFHQHNFDHHVQDLKTLREQAVAAYGAQEDRIPFGHYGGDSDDEDFTMAVGKLSIHDGSDPQLFRRMSHHDLHLVQEEMRNHHDQLDRARHELQEDTAGISRFSAAALAARHRLNIHHPTSSHYRSRHDPDRRNRADEKEMMQMRKAASPPMAGIEIKFPFSISPKMTRCDPDQLPRPRRANSDEDQEYDIGTEGMWSAHVSPVKEPASVGLWGGLCQQQNPGSSKPSTPLRSGLQTPAVEKTNPFGSWTPGRGTKTPRRGGGQLWGGNAFLPLTPPRSKNERSNDVFTAALDEKLHLERQIDEEFSPRVITQIYNYLSLGYPPIARPFDEELAKISRISIAELRKEDRSATGTMKGHVGAPEGEGDAEEDEDGRVKGCRRWDALRLYVREWARQSPLFRIEQNMPRDVGTAMLGNRKGSWGF
ncbi:hypothetical protein LTR64_004885 [Lithohypha guttulata]|uniref:uncharacterized protein n=1 Tax=Lithohypha guttulata TaxID=1690604 RepID=UPI002DDE4583|nr:hypothetical protein LTR51_005278 [Lithohypha guttulata]